MANPGVDASDDDLRSVEVAGYHVPQQLRTVDTVRRLIAAAWEVMAANPCEPLRVDEVLDRAQVATSSFYARFDSLDALVELAGILALGTGPAEAERVGVLPVGPEDAVRRATRVAFAPVLVPGVLPREVLAVGAWRDGYVSAHAPARQHRGRAVAAQLAGHLDVGTAPASHAWVDLATSTCELSWSVGLLALGPAALDDLVGRMEVLGCRLLATSPAVEAEARGRSEPAPPRVVRRSVTGVSDRSAQAVADLRAAVRSALVERGRAMTTGDIARSVHRSRAAFADAFGTVDAALAELARSEQVARIPTELFRPRHDVGPDALIAHLARRIHAWQDEQGIVGRRLLQAAGGHPALAVEVVGQLQDSAELLVGWYGSHLDLGESLARLVFIALLVGELHQVVWGASPRAVAGPEALAALLRPVVLA